jgi:hypothetical protein
LGAHNQKTKVGACVKTTTLVPRSQKIDQENLETDITCSNSAERPLDKFQVDKVEQVNVCKVESLQAN